MAESVSKEILIACVFLGSGIEMWAGAAECDRIGDIHKDCKDEYAWAVVCGLISLIISGILLALTKFKPDLVDGIVGQLCFVVLFGFWVAGVAVLTFQKPFAPAGASNPYYNYAGSEGQAGNGYFATWLSAVAAGWLLVQGVAPLGDAIDQAKAVLDEPKKYLTGIFAASIVEMWHAARICDKAAYCQGMLAWGVAAGAFSAFIVLVWGVLSHFVPSLSPHTKWVALLLSIFWTTATCTLTMPNDAKNCGKDLFCQGLFTQVSNGFIGTWAAMLLSFVLTGMLFGIKMPAAGGQGGSSTKQSSAPSGATEIQSNPTAEKKVEVVEDVEVVEETEVVEEEVVEVNETRE